ncbi:MAG: gamma carbonic anhydrase family protein [Desulfatiglans sp.]|jgi:carbonic anhydrase/acetyltransferase-like protein (isoleucine patch superfamily)|nr:gamma carbonic anhydrase family protein [Desulfatiglans sp.]
MIKAFDGHEPAICESSSICQTVCIIGDVQIGDHSGILPGAVIRGDFAPIRIGRNSFIEDNCVVHSGTPLEIGDNVIVGHNAVIHGRKIGNNTLIGNNATILDNSEIGDNCIIGAGCVVGAGMKIPDRSLVVGVPGKIQGQVKSGSMKTHEAGIQCYLELMDKYRKQGILLSTHHRSL